MADFLANLWMQNILQKLSVMCCCYSGPRRHSVCCYHSILVISHNHHELNFPLLAATFFWARRGCMLAPRGVRFQLWFKIKFPCLIYGKNSAHLPRSAATVFLWPSFELLSVLRSADAEPTLQRLFSSAVFESRFWKQKRLTCLLHARFLHITASIFFQQGVDNKHRCVVCCSYWLPASWVILDAYLTFTETRCPSWNRSTIHYTIPTNLTYSIMNFFWGFSSQSFNSNVWSLVTVRDDSSQFLLPFHGSVLQNRDHVDCEYAHNVLYWSVAHNCHENQKDCIILLITQVQCAELLKCPTFIIFSLFLLQW